MAYIGQGPEQRANVLPAWATLPPYNSSGVYVAQWPVQQTPRVDGRYRINSDSLQRAIATRWLARVQLVHYPNFPALNDPETRWLWFWFDLQIFSGQTFTYSSGFSPDGVSFSGTAVYHDDLGSGLGSGFRWTIDTNSGIDPTSSRTIEWPDDTARMNYNRVVPGGLPGVIQTPPQDDPSFGPYYQAQDVDLWPLSECFPTDQWQIQPGGLPMPGSLVALFTKNVNQSILAGAVRFVEWDVQNWGASGWWDAGVDKTKIITPSGINWIRISINSEFANVGGGVQNLLYKNGARTPGAQYVEMEYPGPEVMNSVSAWLPTVDGDFWQLAVAVSTTRDIIASDSTWFGVEATS